MPNARGPRWGSLLRRTISLYEMGPCSNQPCVVTCRTNAVFPCARWSNNVREHWFCNDQGVLLCTLDKHNPVSSYLLLMLNFGKRSRSVRLGVCGSEL